MNEEEKNIEKITKYIESITLGCAGGIIGNSFTRSIMFASNIAIPIVVKTLDLFTNVDYFIYEINNNHYKGSRNKSFITGNVEAIKYVNKK
jgi:hypothetical protein